MRSLDWMIREVLLHGQTDWVPDSLVAWIASSYCEGDPDDPAIRETSLRILRRVLDENLMEIGRLGGWRGFTRWKVSTDEAIDRVDREWRELGHPTIGNIFWLDITDKGLRLAAESEDS